MENKMKKIGVLHVKSSKLWLSDPVYDREVNAKPDMRYNTSIDDVKKGNWYAYALEGDFGIFGKRNASLVIFHEESFEKVSEEGFNFKPHRQITVDSGQAGIFTDSWMKANKMFHMDGTEAIFEDGVISQSGIGDWVYQTNAIRDKNNQVVAIELDFTPLTKEDMEPGKEHLVG